MLAVAKCNARREIEDPMSMIANAAGKERGSRGLSSRRFPAIASANDDPRTPATLNGQLRVLAMGG